MRRRSSITETRASVDPGTIRTANDLLARNVWGPYFRFLLFLTSIWRNWYWVFPMAFFLAIGVAAVIYKTSELTFTSSAWIRISAQKPFNIFPEQSQTRDEFMAFVKTQLALLRSDNVLEPAYHEIAISAKEAGISLNEVIRHREPTVWLSKNMHIESQDASEIFLISYTTINAEASAIFANAIKTAYLKYIDSQEQIRQRRVADKIIADVDVYKKKIEAMKVELSLLAESIVQKGGVFPIELAEKMQSDSLFTQMITTYAALEMTKMEKQNNEEILDPQKEFPLDDSVVEYLVESDPNMIELVKTEVELQIYLDELTAKKVRADDIMFLSTERKLNGIREQIAKLRGELLEEKKKSWVYQLKTSAQDEIFRLKREIDSQEKVYQSFKEKYDERVNTMSQGNQEILKATFKQGDILREERIVDILMERLNRINIERGAPGQIYSIQDATPAQYAETGKRNRAVIVGAFLAFCFPLGMGWGRELLSERFYHIQQFRMYFPETSVRFIPGTPNPGLSSVVPAKKQRVFHQHIEEICNELYVGKFYRGSKSILLSSVEKDDNQALIASNIARIAAQMTQKPILLLNANFHNYRLERIMEIKSESTGLPDVLKMQCALNDVLVCDEKCENLHYLPGGEAGESPINYFANGNFELLLEELEKHYSMIIISAPPLYTSPESYVLATIADAVVVCVRMCDTRRSSTQQVIEKLNDIDSLPKGFAIS